jgi:uncharacterized protein
MRAILEQIIRYLVDDRNGVRITEIVGAKTRVFEVNLPKEQFGKVIGRGGKTVSALRSLLQTLGQRDNIRVMVEVVENRA